MTAGAFLDACGFNPASNGTGSFVVSAAITGYQTPASAGAVNGTVYSYRAESNDKSQWEEGFGAYTVSTTTLARSTITANSSGGSSAINFTSAPNVYITALSADLQNASLLTSGQMPNPTFSGQVTLTGLAVDGSSSGTGFLMSLGHNVVNNKQYWLGDPDYIGNSSARFLRSMTLTGLTYLSGVSGDNSTNLPVVIDSASWLDFGGVTSGNAGLTASGTQVQAILGDNSGFADFKLRNLTVTGTSPFAKPADQQIFNGSGTWTKPSGFGAKALALIQCWGAGGGGAKSAGGAGKGGGGGAYKERWILFSSLGATETVTIGTGGSASTTSTGNPGGNTTMGSWVTAYGGTGGPGGNGGGMYAQGGWSGYTDGSGVAHQDAILNEGGMGSGVSPIIAGNSVWGGGGGGNGATTTAGTSQYGGAGGTGSASSTATAGTQPGGGGGGTNSGTAASGANGKVVVTVFDGA